MTPIRPNKVTENVRPFCNLSSFMHFGIYRSQRLRCLHTRNMDVDESSDQIKAPDPRGSCKSDCVYMISTASTCSHNCTCMFKTEKEVIFMHDTNIWASLRQNQSSGFPTKRDSNQSHQLQRLARKLKFRP